MKSFRLLVFAGSDLRKVMNALPLSEVADRLDLQVWRRIVNPEDPGVPIDRLSALAIDSVDDLDPVHISIVDPDVFVEYSKLGTIDFLKRWNTRLYGNLERQRSVLQERLKVVGDDNAEADALKERILGLESWLSLVTRWFLTNSFELPPVGRNVVGTTNQGLVLTAETESQPDPPAKTLNTYRLSLFRDEYIEYVRTNHAPKTLENAERVFKAFIAFIGDKPMADIEPADMEKFKQTRKGKVADTTINIDIRTLKAAMTIAVDGGKIPVNPFTKTKSIRVTQKAKSHLTDKEVTKLMDVIKDDGFRKLLQFAVLTGLRRGEIVNLTWNDFDQQTGTITIQSSQAYRVKGGKTRKIPLQKEALDILNSCPTTTDRIFTNGKGKPFAEDFATKKFKVYAKAAGLSADIHLHSLRHTFATMASNNGVSMNILKAVLGHSSVKTTETYTGADQETMREQMGRVSLGGGSTPRKEVPNAEEDAGMPDAGVAEQGQDGILVIKDSGENAL